MKAKHFILPTLLIALLCASCAANGSNSNITDSVTDTTNTVETEDALTDNLPEADFGGAVYNILTQTQSDADFLAESETGSAINDAVFRRNTAVSERFHVTITVDSRASWADGGDHCGTALRNSVNAGDDSYQLYSDCILSAAPNGMQNMLLNLADLEYIDLSQPWWNQSCREALSIEDNVYVMTGSIVPTFTSFMHCLFMNKRLGTNLDLTSTVYDTVFAGDWTIDYFHSLLKDTWQDLNGDGKRDENDSYGYYAQATTWAEIYTYAFGEKTTSRDSDGMPIIKFNMDKYASMVETVYSLLFETEGTYPNEDYGFGMFTDGRALFTTGVFDHAFDSFSNMTDDFAILPYPKWDTAQAGYYTFSDGAAPAVGIPTTVTDTKMASIVTEALAAEGHRSVLPVVYENAIKTRGTRDEESMKIIDIIANGNIIDFGFIFETGGQTMQYLVRAKDSNFASYYEKNIKSWEKKLNSIIESYLEAQQ